MAKISVTQANKFILQDVKKQLKGTALRRYYFRFKDFERPEIYEFFSTDIKDCVLGFDSSPADIHAEGVRHLKTLERRAAAPVYSSEDVADITGKSANDLSS